MSERRSHARFFVANSAGVLRVAVDVALTSTDDELVATSSEPSAIGDALTIEMVVDGKVTRTPVRVEDSRPIVVDETVRHRIRLSHVDPSGQPVDVGWRLWRMKPFSDWSVL